MFTYKIEDYESTADRFFIELLCEQYYNGYENVGRNGLTKRVLNPIVKFENTPLISMRKTAWKNALREMEYFLNGGTHLDDLHPSVHAWWKPFCTKTPNKMHFSYGCSFRKIYNPAQNKIIKVEARDFVDDYEEKFPIIDIDKLEIKGKLTGTLINKGESKAIVLDPVGKRRTNTLYRVQFLDTGFVKIYRDDVIKRGSIKDPYHRKIFNVGYHGEPENHPKKDSAMRVWFHMMERCYSSKSSGYKLYGAKGVKVCKRWHSFANFLNDISKLDGYEYWISDTKNYQLDKDYYGSNVYSPKTCIFLPGYMNAAISKSTGKFTVKDGDGNTFEFLTQAEVANHLSVCRETVIRCIEGKSKKLKKMGIVIEKFENSPKKKYRYQILTDQVESVINTIKTDPSSRRIVISTWIPQHVHSGLINPTNCHGTSIQFFVTGKTLSITMYQRSVDTMLGMPHNWIQYWAFLMWMAHRTNLEVGSFTWMGGDAHIYEAHFECAKEVFNEHLSPKKDQCPELVYSPSSQEFKAEDFYLDREYKPLITKKLPMIV